MDILHTMTKHGLTAKFYQDEDPDSPRNWENLGTMACWHHNYELGNTKLNNYDPDYYIRDLVREHIPNIQNRCLEDVS